ncbi:hypothetical protein GQ53DRAFT_453450 [Thozetella sp. PMI_491]|nr:hypothetical protein GQ53DRAFT_453450 [Thozetella sp. PMI_491]
MLPALTFTLPLLRSRNFLGRCISAARLINRNRLPWEAARSAAARWAWHFPCMAAVLLFYRTGRRGISDAARGRVSPLGRAPPARSAQVSTADAK